MYSFSLYFDKLENRKLTYINIAYVKLSILKFTQKRRGYIRVHRLELPPLSFVIFYLDGSIYLYILSCTPHALFLSLSPGKITNYPVRVLPFQLLCHEKFGLSYM